ncbi:hypothetical protein PG984_008356 [Apiospora sp. TS-2023a]
MASASRRVAVLFCTILQLCLRHAHASQIAAFTRNGWNVPQVVMYQSDTESILYSLCNSIDTPVFPGNATAAFLLPDQYPTLPGTHVSVVGYTDGDGIKTTSGHIVEALYSCNNETGHYEPLKTGPAWVLTDDPKITKPKKPTDLAALIFDGKGGMRLYYRGEPDDALRSIKYVPESEKNVGWVDAGAPVPGGIDGGLAAAFAIPKEVTVMAPITNTDKHVGNLYVSTTLSDEEGLWGIDSVPTPIHAVNLTSPDLQSMPAMNNMTDDNQFSIEYIDDDPKWTFDELDPQAPLGLTFGSSKSMSLFYVGTDKLLHQVRREVDDHKNFQWSNATRPTDEKAMPKADDPKAHFGVAYDPQNDRVWVYYMVNRTMMQLHQPSKGQWDVAVALPKVKPDTAQSGHGGLSKGAKLGIGIGVGLGVPLLLVAIAAYLFFHSRSSRRNRAAENAAAQDAHAAAVAPPSQTGSPAPRYTSGYWNMAPGQQPPHDGPWAVPQQHLGVPYSDQNGYVKPDLGYGWGPQEYKSQYLQQQVPGQMMHHSPPAHTQPTFEMANNQVPVPAQELPVSQNPTSVPQSPTPVQQNQMPNPHPT